MAGAKTMMTVYVIETKVAEFQENGRDRSQQRVSSY